MSMLTPPGSTKGPFGGRRGPKPVSFKPRRPPGRRRALLAVGGLAVAGVLSWGGVQLWNVYGPEGGTGRSAAAKDHPCAHRTGGKGSAAHTGAPDGGPAAHAGKLPSPGSVTVNVYNATTRSGLAKDTADALKKRGFRIGKVGNAPAALDKKVKDTARLTAGRAETGRNAARLLAAQVRLPADGHGDGRHGTAGPHSGAGLRAPSADSRRDGSVDLVLGDRWKGLADAKAAHRAVAALGARQSPTAQDAAPRC